MVQNCWGMGGEIPMILDLDGEVSSLPSCNGVTHLSVCCDSLFFALNSSADFETKASKTTCNCSHIDVPMTFICPVNALKFLIEPKYAHHLCTMSHKQIPQIKTQSGAVAFAHS